MIGGIGGIGGRDSYLTILIDAFTRCSWCTAGLHDTSSLLFLLLLLAARDGTLLCAILESVLRISVRGWNKRPHTYSQVRWLS